MKKSFIYIIGVVLSAMLLCSCGSEKSSTMVEVEKSAVYGESAKYFSIVPDSYQLEYTETALRIKVRLKLEQPIVEGDRIDIYPKLQLQDEAEQVCCSALGLANEEKFQTFMKSKAGTEEDFLFLNSRISGGDVAQIMEDVKGVSIGKLRIHEHLGDVLEKAAEINESISNEDIEDAVEAGKAAIEVSKTALDLLNQLSN